MKIIPGRERKDFEVRFDGLRDCLEVIDKKEKQCYRVTINFLLSKLLGIELEEIIYEE